MTPDPPHVPLCTGGWPARRAPRAAPRAALGDRGRRRAAAAVPADIAAVITDRGKPAEAGARLTLQRALSKLDTQRAVVYAALAPAIKALSPQSSPPTLYG